MKEKSPFFSIVLSIYGVEKYLDRCINSLIGQSFGDFELILVDDGSKDRCPQMCDEWAEKDDRIRVIHKENAGLGMARNTGLENAKGKYIFFIDSDDYVLDGLLEDVYKSLEEHPSEIVFYGFLRVNGSGEIFQTLTPMPEKLQYSDRDEIQNKLLPDFMSANPRTGISSHLRISAWNCCISLSFLRSHGLKFVSEREYICEDVYFYIEMFSYLSDVRILPKAYYCYCQNEGSLTFTYYPERYERIKNFFIAAQELVEQKGYGEDVQARFNSQLISMVLGCLKMEAANGAKEGFRTSRRRIREIAGDPFVLQALRAFECPKKWRWYYFCIQNKRYTLLTILLWVQYRRKGI